MDTIIGAITVAIHHGAYFDNTNIRVVLNAVTEDQEAELLVIYKELSPEICVEDNKRCLILWLTCASEKTKKNWPSPAYPGEATNAQTVTHYGVPP